MENTPKKIMALIVIGALPLAATPVFAQSVDKPENKTAASTHMPAVKDHAEAGNSTVRKYIKNKQKALVKEAVTALNETNDALSLLDQGKNKEALHAMTLATGEMKILMARDPSLGLVPVRVSAHVTDLLGSRREIKETVQEARTALVDGKIQLARALIAPLASEVVVDTTSLPLATFPSAISRAAALVEKGKVEHAKRELSTALNTLVIESTIFPIPLLIAHDSLAEAKSLAGKTDRTAAQNDKIAYLIHLAANEVKRAEALGYGDKKDIQTYQNQINAMLSKTEGGAYDLGWFEDIQKTLDRLFDSSNKAHSPKSAS